MKLINCLAVAFVAPILLVTTMTTTTVAAATTGGRMRRRRCKNLKMVPKERCTPRPRSTPKPIPRIALPPTNHPTRKPTMFPTTPFPSHQPTHDPTSLPSSSPSSAPSKGPTAHPVARPTFPPTIVPKFCLGVPVTEYGGHLYGMYKTAPTNPINWTTADAFFKSQTCCGTKGHLVTIGDPAEKAVVASIANLELAWIGLSYDPTVNTDFVWTTGEPYNSSLVPLVKVAFAVVVNAQTWNGVFFTGSSSPTYTTFSSLFEFDCKP